MREAAVASIAPTAAVADLFRKPLVERRSGLNAVMPADPRVLQLGFLAALLAVGALYRDFDLRATQIALSIGAATLAQSVAMRLGGHRSSNLSAAITGFGVAILLRADAMWIHPVAATAAIASKSLIRVRGKHVFNPANFGVMFALLVLPGAWVSPGQWGQDVALAAWAVVLGAAVVQRAHRADVSWCFLAIFAALLAGRVAWLGQRGAVLEHQMLNGELLVFAFFMLSDPKTAPNHPRGRLVHAALVAALGFIWQFGLNRNNGLLWALLLASPAVPLWDRIWPSVRFEWNANQGDRHAENREVRPACRLAGRSAD